MCLFHTKSILFFSPQILVKMPFFSTSHPSQFLTGCNAINSISGACRQLGTMVMFGFYHICCFLLNTIERLLSTCEIKLLSSQKVKPRQPNLVSFLFGISEFSLGSSYSKFLFKGILGETTHPAPAHHPHSRLYPARVLFAFPSTYSKISQRKSRDPLHLLCLLHKRSAGSPQGMRPWAQIGT